MTAKEKLYVIRIRNWQGKMAVFAITDSLDYCKLVKNEFANKKVTYQLEPDHKALNYFINNPAIIVRKKGFNPYIP